MVLSLLHCRSLSSGAATLSVSLLLFTLLPPKLLTLVCCCSFTVTLHCCYSPPAQAAHSPLLLFIWCCSFTVFSTAATLLLPKLLTLRCCCSSGAARSLSSPLLLLSFCPSCSLSSAAVHLVLLVHCLLHCCYSPSAQAAHSPLLLVHCHSPLLLLSFSPSCPLSSAARSLSFSTAATLLQPKLPTLLCCCFSLWSIDVYLLIIVAMATRKRLYEDIDDFDELNEPVPNASIHAAVMSLSPYKNGENASYFDGTLTDGTRKIRMIGFSSDQQKKLSSYQESQHPIILNNCEIKQSRQGDQYEILL